ncbi:outer membrane lipid asymmetry maintenance protein MlaD [Pseudemcibacter aquimaris]|uniref:outer membrane lipid asymmetry maintenance protein MlaD n=1 Tax=Pseudemcibacter aquimaris TaxID=2857064 RepID=UPI002010CDF5|nr:outer membrane lipid asymmetry maintenance protein MlaD [Pseudemcibacter aquimaris]MCC3860098.1 outer membrane lipid asymmetry maintenance protein MlaD [Pseudemcibacter aquimaris]WDU57427.1 outer membrane lipid asymmetry maintenance protein MlaD [Pseudemcibacter aquimaris]
MRNNLVETMMGAAVLAITGGFLFFAFSNAGVGSVNGSTYYASFDKIDGLATGGEVKISGIKVGTIVGSHLDADTYEAVVEMNIDSSIELPEDTFAKITSEGLLGGNYLVLDPGGSDIMLEDGDTIYETQGAVDLLGLINTFAGSGDNEE